MIDGKIAKIEKIVNANENWEMYFENPTQDYFNVIKEKVKLILGYKKGDFLRHVPDYYGPSDTVGYALIRGYNCQGRCHYCYLQTYFKSPDLVKFKNTDDITNFLEKFLDKFFEVYPNKKIIFYDGDFQDSFGLAFLDFNLDQIKSILEVISNYKNVYLEIRTKQILGSFDKYDIILEEKFKNNLIVSITFSPEEVIKQFEWGTSDLNTRIRFAEYIQSKGFKLGIRIDPIILLNENVNYTVKIYKNLVSILKQRLNEKLIHTWGIGILRLKKKLYKKLKEINSPLVEGLFYDKGFYKYPMDIRKKIYSGILNYIGNNFYICMDGEINF